MSAKEHLPTQGLKKNARPVLIGTAAGIIVCILALLLFSVVMASQNVPQGLISPMATISISLGGFASGLVCTKIKRESGLVYGLVCGVVLSFLLLIASFGFDDSGLGIPALFKVVFILICAMLGGVLGVNTRSSRKKSRR